MGRRHKAKGKRQKAKMALPTLGSHGKERKTILIQSSSATNPIEEETKLLARHPCPSRGAGEKNLFCVLRSLFPFSFFLFPSHSTR
jgi:hypothetical protein